MTRARSDVPPSTLSVELAEEGVGVEYLDGRNVFYHGVPEAVAGPIRTMPRMDVHVLVAAPGGHEGVLTYVNDRATHDEVLESTGVGRVLLDPDEREELFPGVVAEMDGHATVVDADPDLVDGRVFVFEESEFGERSYEIVDSGVGDGSDREGTSSDPPGGGR